MPTDFELARAADRRKVVLREIAKAISTKGYPPSVSELAATTGVSTLTTRRDLDALVAAGKIERDPGVGRGLRLA